MRCQKLHSLLPAYCSAELSGSELSEIERHFHSCAGCRRELAAHRVVHTSVAVLKDATTDDMETTDQVVSKNMYQVSEDFNNRLLNRIAEERFAEVRTKAHLPRRAPLFGKAQLVPVFVSAIALTIAAVGLLRQPLHDSQLANQSELNAPTELASAPVYSPNPSVNSKAVSTPPLGEKLGLTADYMTAQPINNPVYEGLASSGNSSVRRDNSYGSAQNVTNRNSRSRVVVPGKGWQFTTELDLARRIMNNSNRMGVGHIYFEIIQIPRGKSFTIVQMSPHVHLAPTLRRQVIIRPNSVTPQKPQAPAGRLVGGSF